MDSLAVESALFNMYLWENSYEKFIIIIIVTWSPQCKAGREWEHSMSPKTPTPHNQPM